MNKELLKLVKELSLKDKKSLSMKALKVSEETGELAKVVLPFDNAQGTLHRFSDKTKILAEVADVMLSAISIGYDLGFSDEDIDDMLYQKSLKWQGIQAREDEIDPNNIPFEIHVTVEMPDDIEHFKEVCRDSFVKPIVLDLDGVMNDVMTSSKFMGTNKEAYDEMQRISYSLEICGYKVLREKIESVPWHPAAPQNGLTDVMPKDCYFESHIGVVVNGLKDKMLLDTIAKQRNSHLSRNFFKKNGDGSYINMITYRQYEGTMGGFEEKVEELKRHLTLMNFEYEKVVTEFSIYDTKVSHDFLWLENTSEILS